MKGSDNKMKILIVYDSFFGNTEKIAGAMGDSLSCKADVQVTRVSSLKPGQMGDADVLIVGSPTRGFRPTKAISGLLNSLSATALQGKGVAAFDTRISPVDTNSRLLNVLVKIFGYAAEPIAAKMVKKGGNRLIQPEGFYVKGSEGPLKEGELERASEWAKLAVKSW
jgi:flavodoxin